ncbi:MAG: hypothetical protein U0637_09815 [Phycisphaerales bacterium]
MRVLHLAQPLDAPRPWFSFSAHTGDCAGEGSLLAIRDCIQHSAHTHPGETHHTALLGPAHTKSLARALGLHSVTAIAPPLGLPHRAAPALRRLLTRTGPLDAVVTWGTNLRRLARRISHAAPLWIEVDPHSGDVNTAQGHVRTRAAGAAISGSPPPPPIDRPAPPGPAYERARAHLDIAPDERTIALLTDAACPGSATDLIAAASMLLVAGMTATFIIPAPCAELSRAQRRAREGAYASRIIFTHEPASRAAALADIAVCCPGSTAALARHASLSAIARHALLQGATVVAPDAWVSAWKGPDTPPHPRLISARAATTTDIARAILPILDRPPARTRAHAPAPTHGVLSILRSALRAARAD